MRSLLKNKRGMGIGDIYPVVLTIALVAILIAIVLYVLGAFGNQMVNGSLAQNATVAVQTQVSNFVPWIGIILLIVAAAIVLGILIRSLGGGGSRV
jgi:type II secretory pathway component PulF